MNHDPICPPGIKPPGTCLTCQQLAEARLESYQLGYADALRAAAVVVIETAEDSPVVLVVDAVEAMQGLAG